MSDFPDRYACTCPPDVTNCLMTCPSWNDPQYLCACPPWVRTCEPDCPSLQRPKRNRPVDAATLDTLEANATVGAGVPSRTYTREAAELAAQQARPRRTCPKCGVASGNDWRQCSSNCPVPGSPYHDALTQYAFERLPLQEPTDPRYGAEERLYDVLPHLRLAIGMAKVKVPGGKIGLAIVAKHDDGTGQVTATFEGEEFIDDVETVVGSPMQDAINARLDARR